MIAGGMDALLQADGVKELYDLFAEGCIKSYRFDPREKKSMYSPTVLRQVRSFIKEYGLDDAKKIIDTMFGYVHNGRERGKVVGVSIFSTAWRWYANNLLTEALANEAEVADWKKW